MRRICCVGDVAAALDPSTRPRLPYRLTKRDFVCRTRTAQECRETRSRCGRDPRNRRGGRYPAVAHPAAGRGARGLPAPGGPLRGIEARGRTTCGTRRSRPTAGRSASASIGPTVRRDRSSSTSTAAAGRSATSTATTPYAGGSRSRPTASWSRSTTGWRPSTRTRRLWTTRSRRSTGSPTRRRARRRPHAARPRRRQRGRDAHRGGRDPAARRGRPAGRPPGAHLPGHRGIVRDAVVLRERAWATS